MQSPTGGTGEDTVATSAITVRHEAFKLDFHFLCLVANIVVKRKNCTPERSPSFVTHFICIQKRSVLAFMQIYSTKKADFHSNYRLL